MSINAWITYLQTLHLLFSAGVDLLTAHRLMAKQVRFSLIQQRLWAVCQLIAEGQAYYRAIQPCHPPPLIEVYLQFGEQTGQLDTALQGLHDWLRRQHQFKQQCIQALMYPLFIMVISFFFIMLMIFWVLPQFIALYAQMNAEVPVYINQLVNIVTPRACFIFMLCISIMLVALHFTWRSRGILRLYMEYVLYRVPFLGHIYYRSAISQNCELLALAARCGIPLVPSLALLWQYGANANERQAWGLVHTQLLEGSSLSQAMKPLPYFEQTLVELIDIGERTGKLDEVFKQSSIYYTETLSEAMGRFKEAIQPTMMLILGLMLGGWVILLYYPIVQLGYLIG